MLDIFRSAAKTWIVKLLFGLLALSFVAWGVGDSIRRSAFGTGPAMSVAGTDLSAPEVEAEFKRDVERLQAQAGGRLTLEMARKAGLMENTIQQLSTKLLVDAAAKKLGLAVSDDTVVKAVANDPSLKDEKGQVDRERLRMALARMGMTEASFLKVARSEQIRGQIALAVTAGVAVPTTLIDPLARSRFEQRVADVVTVQDSAITQVPVPDAAALESFYKDNTQRFMSPEYRAVTALLLRPSDVAPQISISDEELAKSYDQRRGEFNTPERRQSSQLVLTEQAKADQAAELVTQGRDITAIAKALGGQIIDLGTVTKQEMPPELADAVFQAQSGSTIGPVKSDLGWHVVKVYQVIPGEEKPLDKVKPLIEKELRKEKTAEALSDLSTKVEDALGGGASLEEAAKRFNLSVLTLGGIDAKGNGSDGKKVADLPHAANFLDIAFHTDQGTESQMTENGDDGAFLLRVDGITAPAPRPLDQIKDQAIKAWQADKRHELAKEKADSIAAGLREGNPLTQIAKTPGIETRTSAPFTRDAKDQASAGIPPIAISKLFKADAGGVDVVEDKGGWAAVRLVRVVAADPSAHPDQVRAVRNGLAQSIAGDLSDAYLAVLGETFGVKIDRSQLSREE